MCMKDGIGSSHTNHSLKATLATRLYHKNVDEQLIMQMTGHKSVDGVWSYKRTEQWQIQEACAVIDGSGGKIEKAESSSLVKPIFNFYNCYVTITKKSKSLDS